MKFRTFIYLLFIVYIALMLFFTLHNFSSQEIDLGKSLMGIKLDKIAHFIMFIPYPFLAWTLLSHNKTNLRLISKIVIIFISGAFLAAITELLQRYLTVSRDGDLLDSIADGVGIIVGILLIPLIDKILRVFWKAICK